MIEDDKFNIFWDAFPPCPTSRKSKKGTKTRWEVLVKEGVSPDDLIEAARLFAKERKEKESDYTMGPESFLGPKHDHWRDFLEAGREKAKKKRPKCRLVECQSNEEGTCSFPKPQIVRKDAGDKVAERGGCYSYKAREVVNE